jgi:hypothetical protein
MASAILPAGISRYKKLRPGSSTGQDCPVRLRGAHSLIGEQRWKYGGGGKESNLPASVLPARPVLKTGGATGPLPPPNARRASRQRSTDHIKTSPRAVIAGGVRHNRRSVAGNPPPASPATLVPYRLTEVLRTSRRPQSMYPMVLRTTSGDRKIQVAGWTRSPNNPEGRAPHSMLLRMKTTQAIPPISIGRTERSASNGRPDFAQKQAVRLRTI